MATERNYDGIQFEVLRRAVDPKFNEVHDALTAAYRQGKPFSWRGRDFGVLDKVAFDKLHGLIFHLRDVAFHEANLALPEKERIPAASYDEVYDEAGNVVARCHDLSAAWVATRRAEGLELAI